MFNHLQYHVLLSSSILGTILFWFTNAPVIAENQTSINVATSDTITAEIRLLSKQTSTKASSLLLAQAANQNNNSNGTASIHNTGTSKSNAYDSYNNSNDDSPNPMAQVNSVSQFSDVQPTDWAFQALQSLVERYGCIEGYSNETYRGNRTLTRYEFAAGLNACLDRINELIASSSSELVSKEDLMVLQRLQEEFGAELANLRGRVDTLEAHNAELEANQFSTTTRLNAELIWALEDTFGDRIGGDSDDSNTFLGYRLRLNLESSFTGKDLLRTRLEVSNFGSIADATNTVTTRMNYDNNTNNEITIPHLLYRFPVGSDFTVTAGPVGVGYTDITDTLTPPTVADDARGIVSAFGEYSPFYRQGGGGAAVNWKIHENLILTLGYLAGNPNSPTDSNGLFNGKYNALAQLAYYGDWGALGVAYSHSYAPKGQVGLTALTGSFLADKPFGDDIATSSDTIALQGYYRFSDNFQVHAWGGYISANAEVSGISDIADGKGGEVSRFVDDGSQADIWYGAIGLTFPDVGGKGNLPGILFGLPPRVGSSDVRREGDTSYHLEAFYRIQVTENISITPDFWVVFNPENDSSNPTQYVGVLRTSFNF
ncbi:iron uptake porin [Fischerella sp. PCC 9605]|uniref:iron uptake porin n=1 Tax=Fischerella sp. PCC 9605 TaxID=1173024 RepID=UPI0004BA6065|nr:iron uptake porin [Fischerella sp. PCC 9605]